jgi:hypothetical protein
VSLDHTIDFGLPGVRIEPGDHICAFYVSERERDEVLLPYLRAGLRAGDKCICVVDATDPSTVLASIGDDIDVERSMESSQLDLRASTDAYLRSGRFSTGEMMAFWEESISGAVPGAFRFARSVGEMTWALKDFPGVDELVGYESELNRFLPLHPQVILCLYDLERFGGGIIIDMLRTHPKLLLGGMLIENPHYLSPDEFRAARQ